MAMRPRVLHVTQPVDGGVGAYVAMAAADQARRGWRVAVACPPPDVLAGPLAGELDRLGVPRLDWTAGRAPGLGDVVQVARLRRIVREFGADAVHLHSGARTVADLVHAAGRGGRGGPDGAASRSSRTRDSP
ncbi:glycosyltransferase family 4 protein, partial [Nonomuraea sp. NPDC003201]